ncbi:MAG: translation initiation factor IF-3 [Candidatus Jorgensenbacteria bacterium]|nr:translation initiation factor IF-3 [Candidatus Jorgensenbacteria bacterium]
MGLSYHILIRYRINNQITARELRVIDADGTNLGVMSFAEALKRAGAEALDLIEITASANPPVARILSYDKFRYQKEKEEKKQRQAERPRELKHVRITPRAAKNDLAVKARKASEFLEEGHKVELMIFLRGREKGKKERGLEKLKAFLPMIPTPHTITMEPKFAGRGFVMQIEKKK